MISALESILFAVGEEGLKLEEIEGILDIDEETALKLIDDLKNEYSKKERGLDIKVLGNSYKLITKEENKDYLKKISLEVSNNLSEAALETLAIIAYNEPITRVAIDEIRGVNSSQMVRNLIAKGLIMNSGKSDLPGRPNLYKTTDYFLDYFNLPDLSKLPVIDRDEVEVLDDKDLYESKYTEV
ncbi:MAG: SMC-Scp complex subunit ScpB [Bacilli bacterium]|nr:SMC-Scp complex subunit ScpB [Bacilli bacterium]